MRIRGCLRTARAIAVRCFCPPESVMPRSPTSVSKPSGHSRTSSPSPALCSAPANLRLLAHVGLVLDRGLDGEDRVHALEARGAALVEVDNVAQGDEWPDEYAEVEDELDDLARRDVAAQRQPAAVPDDDDVAD